MKIRAAGNNNIATIIETKAIRLVPENSQLVPGTSRSTWPRPK